MSSSHAQLTLHDPDLGHVLCLSLCVVCTSQALYATGILLSTGLFLRRPAGPAWELMTVLLTGRILC